MSGMEADKTIVDLAAESGQFNTLVAAVQAAGLVETLSGEGPYTVFAPTDAAFEQAFSRFRFNSRRAFS